MVWLAELLSCVVLCVRFEIHWYKSPATKHVPSEPTVQLLATTHLHNPYYERRKPEAEELSQCITSSRVFNPRVPALAPKGFFACPLPASHPVLPAPPNRRAHQEHPPPLRGRDGTRNAKNDGFGVGIGLDWIGWTNVMAIEFF